MCWARCCKQAQAGVIRPVQIVQQQRDRLAQRQRLEETRHRPEEALLLLRAPIRAARLAILYGVGQEPLHLWPGARQLLADGGRGVGDGGQQRLDKGIVGHRLIRLLAATRHDQKPTLLRRDARLLREPCLAHARLTGEKHHFGRAAQCRVERVGDVSQFVLAGHDGTVGQRAQKPAHRAPSQRRARAITRAIVCHCCHCGHCDQRHPVAARRAVASRRRKRLGQRRRVVDARRPETPRTAPARVRAPRRAARWSFCGARG